MDFSGKNSFEGTGTPQGVKSIFDFENVKRSSNFPNFPEMDDFGRESLGIVNLNALDIGRESLGITNIKTSDFVGSSLPEITITNSSPNRSNRTDIFNNAFLLSSRNVISVSSSISSFNSLNPSFNSASLNSDIFSRINSCSSYNSNIFDEAFTSLDSDILSRINSCSNYNSNIFDKAFINSSDFNRQFCRTKSLTSSLYATSDTELKTEPHQRIKSLPSNLESVQVPKDVKGRKRDSSVDLNDDFSDSVFIEANHLAARIEDGSILELDPPENDMLDLIQEPEVLKNVSTSGTEAKSFTDQVELSKTDEVPPVPSLNASNDQNPNLSTKIFLKHDESDCSSMNKSHNLSKSKDRKEILNTLSEILNSDNLISEKQKSDCQNMISSLAEILVSSSDSGKSNNLDDSGRSSIANELVGTSQDPECYEILDLSKNKSQLESSTNYNESDENCKPLDLSLKSKSSNSEKPKSVVKENKNLRNCSQLSNKSTSLDERTNTFKLKKAEDKLSVKKGPVKAVVPVNNMTKRKSESSKLQKTPTRNEPHQSAFKLKKTSTPINELLLRPMAQSTPGTPCSVSPSNKLAYSTDDSPKGMKQKLNYSGSNLPINVNQGPKNKPSFIRRHSVEDIKKGQEASRRLHRSYSVGESAKPSKIASSVKELKRNTNTIKEKSLTKSQCKK